MAGLIGLDAMRLAGVRPDLRAVPAMLGRFGSLLGDEPAPDARPADLVIALSPAGDAVALSDRRAGTEGPLAAAPLEPEALADALAALRGAGRAFGAARLLLPPSFCFIRTLPCPSGSLPRMRQLLALELEASTPFRSAAVLSDWYVESHDPADGTLTVRHVVLARSRIAPLTDALAAAGIPLRSVLVGTSETALVPVDLLADGHHPLPSLFSRVRAVDAALIGAAILLAVAAFTTVRWRQEAILADLDRQIVETRSRSARAPGGVSAAAVAPLTALRSRPSLPAILDEVASALPDAIHVERLVVDDQGLALSLRSRDPLPAPADLPPLAGFGPARLVADESGPWGAGILVAMPFAVTRGIAP